MKKNKNYIFAIIIPIIFNTCKPNTLVQNKYEIEDKQCKYIIHSTLNGNSSFVYVQSENDTVYLFNFRDSLKFEDKIFSDKITIRKIKETVKYHLELRNFMRNQPTTMDGGGVKLYLEYFNNRLEAKFLQVDNYKEISLKLDSLVNYLKQNNKRYKDFF